MYEYTRNNYFQWGYEIGIPFSPLPAEAVKSELWFGIDPEHKIIPDSRETIRSTSLDTAGYLLGEADRLEMEPSLFLSGGIDSEAMVYAFLAVCGKTRPFRCTTVRLTDGLNWNEVEVATRLCERNNIQQDIIDINPFELWYRLPSYLTEFRLESGILYVILEALFRNSGRFQIIGGNPVFRLDHKWNPKYLGLEVGSAVLCHTRYWQTMGQPGVALFHQYSPQQYYAWLNHPLIAAWSKQLHVGITDFSPLKALIYQTEFPEISESRPKWSGEEHLRNHIDDLWKHAWAKHRPFNTRAWRSRDEILAELVYPVESD